MEDINSKFAVYNHSNGNIHLFEEDTFSHMPLYDDVFENVTITFNDNCSITLEGDKHQYSLTLEDILVAKMEDKPHTSYVERTRFTNKEVVRRGWYRLAENKHVTLIMSHYTIEQ